MKNGSLRVRGAAVVEHQRAVRKQNTARVKGYFQEFPFSTQEDAAAQLGLSRATVARAISELKKEGMAGPKPGISGA